MFAQVGDNGSRNKSNGSGSGEKWSGAANGWEASAFAYVGGAMRERGCVPLAVLACASGKGELQFTEMQEMGQGQ